MSKELSVQELKRLWSFLIETFEFTEEQNAAINYQIPMTQKIYDSILDRCDEIGKDIDSLFYRMLTEYPEFMAVRADKIFEEVRGIELPIISEEEKEIQKQELCDKIRAEYGDNIIER